MKNNEMVDNNDYVVIGLDRYNRMRDELAVLRHEYEAQQATIRQMADQQIYLQSQLDLELDREKESDELTEGVKKKRRTKSEIMEREVKADREIEEGEAGGQSG